MCLEKRTASKEIKFGLTSVLLSKTDAVMMNNNFRIYLYYPKTSVVIIFTKYVTDNIRNTDFSTYEPLCR